MILRTVETAIEVAIAHKGIYFKHARAELRVLRDALQIVIREKALQDWESSQSTELADAIRLLQRIASEAE